MITVPELHPWRTEACTEVCTTLNRGFLVEIAIVAVEAVLIAALIGPGACEANRVVDDDARGDGRVRG